MMTDADFATQVPTTPTFTETMPPVTSSPELPSVSGYVDTRHTHQPVGPPCCTGCSQPILDQFILQLQGHVWHADCLRCSVCNILLSHVCYSGNSQLYCQDDFFSLYGAGCSSCTEAIAPTDIVRRAHENVYHMDCFRCRVCQHQLHTGDQFYLCVDGQLLCKVDYLAISVEEQCQEEDANSTSDVSKYGANRGHLCAQNPNPGSDIVENIAMEVGAQTAEARPWFRQKRTETQHKGSSSNPGNTENPSCRISRVVAPPGGYPLPIVNIDCVGSRSLLLGRQPNVMTDDSTINTTTTSGQPPEGANQSCMSTRTPGLAPDSRTHWTGWEDMWSDEFVPPNVDLEPENINDGEVVGFRCQNPVTHISSQGLQDNLYM